MSDRPISTDVSRPGVTYKDHAHAFRGGIKAGAGMPLIMVLSGLTGFGALAHDSGLSLDISVALTLGLWGMPGQVAMAELHALGAPVLAIVAASSMANLRFLPMALVMMPVFRGHPLARTWRFLLTHLMAINPWTVFMRRGPQIAVEFRVPFFIGLSLICYLGGAVGTAMGFILAGTLPFAVTVSLIFLNPAYFLFVFSSVRQRNCIIAVVLGAIAGPLLHHVDPDWSVPLCGLLAGTTAFFLDRSMGGKRGSV